MGTDGAHLGSGHPGGQLVQICAIFSGASVRSMENVATYSEARSEYTKQLATFIVPALVGWFQTLWQRNAGNRQQCMALFQSECEEVARWNTDRVHDEVRVLIERTGCDYMEELMTAVFIAHTKVLTAVRLSQKQKKLSITVPKLDHFIHRVFREAARNFWKTPFLFTAEGSVVERQKNVLQIEALANEAIATAVRSLLPVKQILKDYLEDDTEEIDEADAVVAAAAAAAVPEAVAEELGQTGGGEVVDAEAVAEAPADVAVVPVAAAAAAAVLEEPEAAAPPVVKIDTEPVVTFSDTKAVFGSDGVHMEEMGDDDVSDLPADGILTIEGPDTPLGLDDAEDLDAPSAAPPVNDLIDEKDVEVLDLN
jgi:hypothetical protein